MTHLTDAEFETLLTDPTASHPHLAQCSRCQQELHSLRGSFGDLRLALTGLAGEAAPAPVAVRPRSRWIPALSLATACGLLAAAGVAGLTAHSRPAQQPAAVVQPTQQDDEALLQGIHDDLAAPIAPSLTPLSVDTSR